MRSPYGSRMPRVCDGHVIVDGSILPRGMRRTPTESQVNRNCGVKVMDDLLHLMDPPETAHNDTFMQHREHRAHGIRDTKQNTAKSPEAELYIYS
jgi:hypothetical protein